MADPIPPYTLRFHPDLCARLQAENKATAAAPQEALDALSTRLHDFIDKLRTAFGEMPAAGDYIEINEYDCYKVHSRSFVHLKTGVLQFSLLIQDVATD
jgi:hypothetical protein